MKKTTRLVHLGYEVGTGKEVSIPVEHTIVTGQSQKAGKTTTLEALAGRATSEGLRFALAFITKRGEGAFQNADPIRPVFRDRADWQYVSAVLEATMREKLKFERSWIMRASKGARTLVEVQGNVQRLMKESKGLSGDVYYALNEYLEIVIPRLGKIPFASGVALAHRVSVADLGDGALYPLEIQFLIIASMLEYVYQHHENVITIIPEAWEFLPEGRGSPVKQSAVALIRKGAALGNFIWLDGQDIGGIDKEMLRLCTVWLIGVQREANEIERLLKNIPAGIAKPKPADIAMLEIGQFFACWGKHIFKVYVTPQWMPREDACAIAMGRKPIPDMLPSSPYGDRKPPVRLTEKRIAKPKEPEPMAAEKIIPLTDAQFRELLKSVKDAPPAPETPQGLKPAPAREYTLPESLDNEALFQAFKKRLIDEAPGIIHLLLEKPEINLTIERPVVHADGKTVRGMMALLTYEGFFDPTANGAAAFNETKRRWNNKGNSIRVYEQLDNLVESGFLTKEKDGYRTVEGAKKQIKRS